MWLRTCRCWMIYPITRTSVVIRKLWLAASSSSCPPTPLPLRFLKSRSWPRTAPPTSPTPSSCYHREGGTNDRGCDWHHRRSALRRKLHLAILCHRRPYTESRIWETLHPPFREDEFRPPAHSPCSRMLPMLVVLSSWSPKISMAMLSLFAFSTSRFTDNNRSRSSLSRLLTSFTTAIHPRRFGHLHWVGHQDRAFHPWYIDIQPPRALGTSRKALRYRYHQGRSFVIFQKMVSLMAFSPGSKTWIMSSVISYSSLLRRTSRNLYWPAAETTQVVIVNTQSPDWRLPPSVVTAAHSVRVEETVFDHPLFTSPGINSALRRPSILSPLFAHGLSFAVWTIQCTSQRHNHLLWPPDSLRLGLSLLSASSFLWTRLSGLSEYVHPSSQN